MNKYRTIPVVITIMILTALAIPTTAGDNADLTLILNQVRQQAAELDRRITRIEDVNAIENLQRSYGFMVDKALWKQVADLFSDDGTLEIGGRGVFVGRERIHAYLSFLGKEGPVYGRLFDHMQLQPIIHVAPEGKTAQGRWRFFAQGGQLGSSDDNGTPGSGTGYLGMGTYENDYVKENGIWKFKTLHAYFRMYTRDTEGWGKTAQPMTRPEADLPPDLPPTVVYDQYPATFIPPFHYRNPVTGR